MSFRKVEALVNVDNLKEVEAVVHGMVAVSEVMMLVLGAALSLSLADTALLLWASRSSQVRGVMGQV